MFVFAVRRLQERLSGLSLWASYDHVSPLSFFTINDDTLPPVPPEYEWLSTVEWMQIGLFGAQESLLGSQVWVLCKLPDQQETQAHYWLCGR